jgi:UPF0755 protein
MDSSPTPTDSRKLEDKSSSHQTRKTNKFAIFLVFALIYNLSVFFYFSFISAPADFPAGTVVKIEQGESLRSVSQELLRAHIIRSRVLFEAFVILYGAELRIKYSDYLFETKLPVYEVARRIAKGEHHLAPISVTIPEGFDTGEIADTFESKLEDFHKNKFLSISASLEGYLFPDTYYFYSTAEEGNVIESMNDNFNKKIAPLRPLIADLGKSASRTEKQIIVMASIIEREAKGESDRGFISGILWKRFGLSMPLQVDAAPETYKIVGLPKSPICNPGLAAIKSAISPQSSPYLYYLHDKDGNIHYARTYSEHLNNKLKYIK